MNILEIEGVTKIYNAKKTHKTIVAVDDLSFAVQEGEITGLIGPNGAGKSTVLKMITGLAYATKGNIKINGFDVVKQRRQALSCVGAIVENPDMYLDWTGEENLKYFLSLQGESMNKEERTARAEELLKLVGLFERRKSKVRTYSLGMKQRLGIAQALLYRPKLLILDEPTNGLDPEGIKEIRDILKHLAQTYSMGILVSSHLLAEMQLTCSRFIILNKGKMVSDLKPEEVAEESNIYVLTTDDVVTAKDILRTQFQIEGQLVGEGKVEFSSDRSSGDIAKGLILAGVNVYGIAPKKKTLEEMFISVTHKREE